MNWFAKSRDKDKWMLALKLLEVNVTSYKMPPLRGTGSNRLVPSSSVPKMRALAFGVRANLWRSPWFVGGNNFLGQRVGEGRTPRRLRCSSRQYLSIAEEEEHVVEAKEAYPRRLISCKIESFPNVEDITSCVNNGSSIISSCKFAQLSGFVTTCCSKFPQLLGFFLEFHPWYYLVTSQTCIVDGCIYWFSSILRFPLVSVVWFLKITFLTLPSLLWT